MIQHETTRLFPVLLVEPNPQHAADLASLLDAACFEVLISESPAAALRALDIHG